VGDRWGKSADAPNNTKRGLLTGNGVGALLLLGSGLVPTLQESVINDGRRAPVGGQKQVNDAYRLATEE